MWLIPAGQVFENVAVLARIHAGNDDSGLVAAFIRRNRGVDSDDNPRQRRRAGYAVIVEPIQLPKSARGVAEKLGL